MTLIEIDYGVDEWDEDFEDDDDLSNEDDPLDSELDEVDDGIEVEEDDWPSEAEGLEGIGIVIEDEDEEEY